MLDIDNGFLNDFEDANDVCYSFGGNTAEVIYNFICETVNDFEYITLNKGLTVISVSFFDSVVFRIRINSKTQCLDTDMPLAFEYMPNIEGATANKTTVHIPIRTNQKSADTIKNMLLEIYDIRRSQVSGDAFGCCNDHVKCSDAGYCLHLKEKEYWGCSYRKNLEAGKVFYGEKSNGCNE